MRFLFALAGDDGKASSRVRGYWVAEELTRCGHSCSLVVADSAPGILTLATRIPGCHCIVFQKTYSKYHLWLMRFAHFLGKKVYLDIDDAPSRTNNPQTLRYFATMARAADRVLAGSQELCELARSMGADACLLPSGIRLERYDQRMHAPVRERPIIGWIGNGLHYRSDLLELLLKPLTELATQRRLGLRIIGSMQDSALHEAFGAIPNLDVEFLDSIDWSDDQACRDAFKGIDIGVYPLLDNSFNRYKCGYKALEYMASGLPTVASPNPGVEELLAEGAEGFYARTDSEWVSRLHTLIDDHELRHRMGATGRSKVSENYAVTHTAKILEQALLGSENRQGSV